MRFAAGLLLPPPTTVNRIPLCAVLCAAVTSARGQAPYVHYEARHTHPIGLSPDGTRLFVLNTPDARLSVFDISNPANPSPVLVAEIPVGMEPVSLRARTNDEVWVVNELSDSVSVVSVPGQNVLATLRAGDEPADIVFAQGRAFVSCARSNTIRVFNATTRAELTVLDPYGLDPRALAVNAAGTRVYAAFQMSGNRTTVLPHTQAPPQPPPVNEALPPPPRTALIVPASDERIQYTVLDHDVVEINAVTMDVLGHFGGAGTNHFDLAVHPVTGDLWTANTEALNLTRFEPALRGHFVDNRLTRIALPSGTPEVFDLNAGHDYSTLPNPAEQETALAQPTAISFAPDGSHAWVAAFASDRVAKVLTDGSVAARVDVRIPGSAAMRGPRGLALHAGQGRLYVMNKLANTVTVIDTAAAAVLAEVPAGSHDPMPAPIKNGRGFLFDARLSGNGTASCGSCHLDADRDGLAWDLGDPGGEMITVMGKNLSAHDLTDRPRTMHPMKGPMTTQTLRGLHNGNSAAAPFHWRGDRPTLQSFNPTFDKLMGGLMLGETEINALADYINSLRHHPNPHLRLDRTPPVLFELGSTSNGRNLFGIHNNHCAVCHVLPSSTGNNIDLMNEVGSTQPIKDPSLALVYQKLNFFPQIGSTTLSGFGMLHDGTGSSLPTVHPYILSELTNTQQFVDVKAFVLTLDTGTAPAIGYEVTATVANRVTDPVQLDIAELENQTARGNCEVVVRGLLHGRQRQFFLDYANEAYVYRSDRAGDPPLDSLALLEMLQPGDSLTWMGVPFGQGRRFGGDRDDDGLLDADESAPLPLITTVDGTVILQWPNEHADWYAQSADTLNGPWITVTQPRVTAGPFFSIQPLTTPGSRGFFRLTRTW
jgi:YVTN family beta-propeller protein